MISPYLFYLQSSIMMTASIAKHNTDHSVSKPLISKNNPSCADHPSPNRNKLNKTRATQSVAYPRA